MSLDLVDGQGSSAPDDHEANDYAATASSLEV